MFTISESASCHLNQSSRALRSSQSRTFGHSCVADHAARENTSGAGNASSYRLLSVCLAVGWGGEHPRRGSICLLNPLCVPRISSSPLCPLGTLQLSFFTLLPFYRNHLCFSPPRQYFIYLCTSTMPTSVDTHSIY